MPSTFLNACKNFVNRIKDKIKKFTKPTTVALTAGTLSDLPRSRADSFCERFIGSLRRECLDFFLIVHRKQLHNLVKAYLTYYNQQRPHQGIEQRIPAR